MTYNDVSRNEKAISGALALATHLLFLALLVFGVSWQQKKPDSAVIVDLWNNLPPLPQPKVEEPRPEVKPVPEPPKPVPKVEPKPVPKPEPKPVIKPDIALKEKLAKERKQKEQIEAKKREDEKKKQAALKVQQDKLDKAKLEKERDEALRKVLVEKESAQAAAAAQARLLDEYKRRVSERIKRFIVLPPNIQGNPEAQFEVVQIPGGEVLSVKLKRSSGVAAYDGAVERAILKAQPLPPPPDPARFNEVRELELKFRPKE
jgi:colicin import membrane protein